LSFYFPIVFSLIFYRLASEPDESKRKELVEIFAQCRLQIARLQIAFTWVTRNLPILRAIDEISYVLNRRNSVMEQVWMELHNMMSKPDWYPKVGSLWDIPTSAHVLNSRSYQWLPNALQSEIVDNRIQSMSTQAELSRRLSNQLNLNLLLRRIPPSFRQIRVEDGRALLKVDNEFEAGVTLRILPSTQNSPQLRWTLTSWNLCLPWKYTAGAAKSMSACCHSLSLAQQQVLISSFNEKCASNFVDFIFVFSFVDFILVS
jgi:hypothetical protein